MPDIVDIDTMFGPMPAAAADLSVDDLGALMKRHAVRACCTLSTIGVLLDHNAGNAATRAACQEQASLIPVATINPQMYFGEEDALAPGGFKMVRLFPSAQGWAPDFAPCLSLVARLASEGVPLMLELSRCGDASRFMAAIANYPGPVILGSVDESSLAEAIVLMRTHSRLHVATSNLLAVGAIKHCAAAVGIERLLYGSGAPSRPMASALGVLRFADLPETDRDAILGGNARRLLSV